MIESTTARHRAGRPEGGFTIIELMITVAVASLLMAIAVPSFNQMVVSGRLTAQSNEFVAALSLARSEAIKRNASVTLCRANSATATDCSTASGTWTNWIVRANGNVVHGGTVNTFGNALVVQSTLTTDQVVFGPDGLARTGSAMVSNHTIRVCARRSNDRNIRLVTLGAGSRMSTTVQSGAC